MTPTSVRLFGLVALGFGALGLWSGDFAAVWQPVPVDLPGRRLLAYAAAVVFLGGGALVQAAAFRRSAALALAALYAAFGALWLLRAASHPLIFATWAGVLEQLAVAAAGVLVALDLPPATRTYAVARPAVALFGVCCVAFGFNHFFALKETAALTPSWLPPGPMTWAVMTGFFHVAGGAAILIGTARLAAARLLLLMFAGFGLLVWAPVLLAHPHSHTAWSGNLVNLSLVTAAWVVSDAVERGRALQPSDALRLAAAKPA